MLVSDVTDGKLATLLAFDRNSVRFVQRHKGKEQLPLVVVMMKITLRKIYFWRLRETCSMTV